jgi:hypothetical protein
MITQVTVLSTSSAEMGILAAHFTAKETEALREKITFPESSLQLGVWLGLLA